MLDVSEQRMSEQRWTDAGAFPKVVLLDTTSFCNLKCSMCASKSMTRLRGRMSMELFRKLVDEIADADRTVRLWMVFFGEALILRYRLMWQILYAKRQGLSDIVLNSNGNLLDKEMAVALVESGLDAIYIGIDAFSRETYNILRVGGDYDRVVGNVNTLLDLKQKMGAATPRVFVQFVEMGENQHEVEGFKHYWTGQGAEVKIRPKVTWASAVEPWKVSQEERHPCYWAMKTLNVCWDGRVVLCSVDYDAQYVAGDVNKTSIRDVWNGPLKEMREAHLSKDYVKLPRFCQACTDWQMARAEYYQ